MPLKMDAVLCPLPIFAPIFDLSQQRRFDPNAAVRDLFGIRLSFPD